MGREPCPVWLEGMSDREKRLSGWSGTLWKPAGSCPSLPLESALDDLDLNEFGVAALEKTFDSSTGPHPGSITIGTGQGVGGWRAFQGPR